MNHALNALRHHVTGAVERGEKAAIVEKRARHWPQWERVNGAFSARYFANGRTDVRRESTGEIVRSRSPSLQDDMRRGAYHSALFYLFGREAESEIDAAA